MKIIKCLIYLILANHIVSFANTFDDNYKQYPTPAICGDFLEQIGKKPEGVVFDSCTIYPEGQAHMKAVYKLTGKDADAIEQYLVKEFDMAKLRFVCCYWEASEPTPERIKLDGFYTDPKTHYEYSINMHSEESLMTDRQKWSEIPIFYIVVTTYTVEI